PLDVGIFRLLQSGWSKHCQELAATRDPVTQDTIIKEYIVIWEKYLTLHCIELAFRKTVIWPFNP
ncbi:hypothetical protein K439DRAFT_1292352, partial [Ramaria rubella]